MSGPSWAKRHSVSAYFLLTFSVSWAGAFLVVAPYVLRRIAIPTFSGILTFPAMLLGPLVGGIVMAGVTGGRSGISSIWARMNPARIALRWYAALLIPPALVLATLAFLAHFVSPRFTPNHFYPGLAFGVPAGLCEELGWTGFALPALRQRLPIIPSAILLGLLWGTWHLPAINYLGASAPHGHYWYPFFFAFGFAMLAMRALIVWLYENTGSVLLAQLMHISSTGSLVIFSPPVSSLQESFWYATYGVLLSITAAAVLWKAKKPAENQNKPSSADGP